MRQMDTILVAVGVPTKEGAGVMAVQSQIVTVTQDKLYTPEVQSAKESVQEEEKPIMSSNNTVETNTKEFTKTEVQELVAEREKEDGWDIPDISDLLDSLCDTDLVQKDSFVCHATEGSTGPECQSRGEEAGESDTDTEHMSWDWDTTHWTAEHTDKHHPRQTERIRRDQLANGKPSHSEPTATPPTHSLHTAVQLHSATTSMDSNGNLG